VGGLMGLERQTSSAKFSQREIALFKSYVEVRNSELRLVLWPATRPDSAPIWAGEQALIQTKACALLSLLPV